MTMKLVRGPDKRPVDTVFGDLQPGQCFIAIYATHAVVLQRLALGPNEAVNASRLDNGAPRMFGETDTVYPVTVDAVWTPDK